MTAEQRDRELILGALRASPGATMRELQERTSLRESRLWALMCSMSRERLVTRSGPG